MQLRSLPPVWFPSCVFVIPTPIYAFHPSYLLLSFSALIHTRGPPRSNTHLSCPLIRVQPSRSLSAAALSTRRPSTTAPCERLRRRETATADWRGGDRRRNGQPHSCNRPGGRQARPSGRSDSTELVWSGPIRAGPVLAGRGPVAWAPDYVLRVRLVQVF